MSLMGYTRDDLEAMMNNLEYAITYLPDNASNDEAREQLRNVWNLLDGLIVEGRV